MLIATSAIERIFNWMTRVRPVFEYVEVLWDELETTNKNITIRPSLGFRVPGRDDEM